jgi:hypothetical protein
MVKPTATPIITCCRATHTAFAEKIGISTGEERGDDNGDDDAQPHFDTLGDRFLAENGAVEISAMMRSIGQK